MGVPGFFSWLLKHYKQNDIILNCFPDDVSVDILYIDANCLFHPQCFKVLHHIPDWTDSDNLEGKMIKRILNYLDYLKNYVKPKKMVISVDGVAPMAKMNQQRLRRYRAIDDLIMKENIKRKHNKPISNRWTNTVITPGTEFMERLHNEIIKYINRNHNGIKMVYSSYHTPGEGEHKILNDIRTKVDTDETYVIYGLDADLIFLSMSSQKNNLYLLREVFQLGNAGKSNGNYDQLDPVNDVEEDLNYVSIDEMKDCFYAQICKQMTEKHNIDFEIDQQSLINDFIFICFFLGNDFIPHLPSLDIKVGGLDLILNAYINVFCNTQTNFISIDPIYINTIFLEMFVKYISSREDHYFKKILPYHKTKIKKRFCRSRNPYDQEVWNIENMRNIEIDDPVKLGVDTSDMWKTRFYNHYFNIEYYYKDLADHLSFEFLKSLKWVAEYYFKGCSSWSWKFPYSHSPFISDVYNYINTHIVTDIVDINEIEIPDDGCLSPCQQLLAVLPPACSNLLPQEYRYLTTSERSSIIDFFPSDIELDMINKDANWQCIPKIPQVDPLRIKGVVKNIKLSKKEKIRNTVSEEIVV